MKDFIVIYIIGSILSSLIVLNVYMTLPKCYKEKLTKSDVILTFSMAIVSSFAFIIFIVIDILFEYITRHMNKY